MQISKFYFVACIFFCFVGCVSTNQPNLKSTNKPVYRKPLKEVVYKPSGEWEIRKVSDLDKLKKLGAKVSQKGKTIYLDLNGITLDGSKQKGDGGQSEDQTPLFRARVPLVVSNGFVKNNKNAMVFYGSDSKVDKITWLTVGEDAVATADNAKRLTVQNCEFIGGPKNDKLLQLNEADGARVFDNVFWGAITGVRVGKIDFSRSEDRAFCGQNRFFDVDTAWNVAKVNLVVETPNQYTNVRLPFKTTNGAKIYDKGSTISTTK